MRNCGGLPPCCAATCPCTTLSALPPLLQAPPPSCGPSWRTACWTQTAPAASTRWAGSRTCLPSFSCACCPASPRLLQPGCVVVPAAGCDRQHGWCRLLRHTAWLSTPGGWVGGRLFCLLGHRTAGRVTPLHAWPAASRCRPDRRPRLLVSQPLPSSTTNSTGGDGAGRQIARCSTCKHHLSAHAVTKAIAAPHCRR